MIFLDRSLPRSVARALRMVRNDVIWLEDWPAFDENTPDIVWLERAGQEGWIVVTRDKRIRTRPHERSALLRYGVGCFVLAQNRNLTRWEYLKLLTATLDHMETLFDTTPRPFIFAVYSDGSIRHVRLK
ncbi:MAG: hypothetical protein OWU33_04140 [Firmicutes bacterium]|nr:hypothetical protein [Bacillota bacterium]